MNFAPITGMCPVLKGKQPQVLSLPLDVPGSLDSSRMRDQENAVLITQSVHGVSLRRNLVIRVDLFMTIESMDVIGLIKWDAQEKMSWESGVLKMINTTDSTRIPDTTTMKRLSSHVSMINPDSFIVQKDMLQILIP